MLGVSPPELVGRRDCRRTVGGLARDDLGDDVERLRQSVECRPIKDLGLRAGPVGPQPEAQGRVKKLPESGLRGYRGYERAELPQAVGDVLLDKVGV
jgi:hypothetical protein